MKSIYSKKQKCNIATPETVSEAINELQEFFECDMWYACNNEWKTETKMIKYLEIHFNILKKQVKSIQNDKKIQNKRQKIS